MAKTAVANWIPDGYTVPGYVAESEKGLYGACAFKYRPGIAGEARYVMEPGLEPEESERRYREFFVNHVLEWDIKNPLTGKMVEINLGNVARVNPLLRGEINSICFGTRKSDPHPVTGETAERPDVAANAGN